jgi:hypothetical protein
MGQGGFDIPLLACFRAAAEQDDKAVAVLAEVDAVAGAEVDLVFDDPAADAFEVGRVSLTDARDGNRDLGSRLCIEPGEPLGEGATAARVF